MMLTGRPARQGKRRLRDGWVGGQGLVQKGPKPDADFDQAVADCGRVRLDVSRVDRDSPFGLPMGQALVLGVIPAAGVGAGAAPDLRGDRDREGLVCPVDGAGRPPGGPVLVGDVLEQVPGPRVWVTGEAFLDQAAIPDRMQILTARRGSDGPGPETP